MLYVGLVSILGVVSAVCRDDNDLLWINDSKATNVDATYTGLKGFTKQRAVVLLGGLAKVFFWHMWLILSGTQSLGGSIFVIITAYRGEK